MLNKKRSDPDTQVDQLGELGDGGVVDVRPAQGVPDQELASSADQLLLQHPS